MCVAAAPAMLALSVGSQAAGFIGQSQSASAQARYQASRYAEVTESAVESLRNKIRLTDERAFQESASAARESMEIARQGDRGAGSAAVVSAAGNVGGQTAAELQREYRAIEADNQNALQTSLEWTMTQLGEQVEGFHAEAEGRIASAAPAPVQSPSPLSLILGVGSSVLDYQTQQTNNAPPDGGLAGDTNLNLVGIL